MQYGLLRIMLNIVETGIWSKPDRKTPFGSCSTQHSALIHWRRVLPTEASKRHTTPGITQSSDERVSYVISLALVSLELEKSGAPRARSFFLSSAPPLSELQQSRSEVIGGNFHDKRRGGGKR